MEYKQIQIDFYEENFKLEQSVYDFYESKNFEISLGSYSYFQSKEPMSLENANNILLEFCREFSSLKKDIKNCVIIETSKPRSLKHLFGSSLGDNKGWNSLINEYSEKIIELDGEVRYTKQKYGGLVFEITYPLDSINQEKIIFLEQEAEKKSFTICEYCGAKGELRELKNSYLQTLCDKCCKIKEYQILRK